jgi:hypothetical protein
VGGKGIKSFLELNVEVAGISKVFICLRYPFMNLDRNRAAEVKSGQESLPRLANLA